MGVVGLYVQRIDWFASSKPQLYPVTNDECWKCGQPNPGLAHAVYEYVAALLAERLRQEFDGHLDAHGCAERGGFGHCDEAMALFALLPDGDRVIVA